MWLARDCDLLSTPVLPLSCCQNFGSSTTFAGRQTFACSPLLGVCHLFVGPTALSVVVHSHSYNIAYGISKTKTKWLAVSKQKKKQQKRSKTKQNEPGQPQLRWGTSYTSHRQQKQIPQSKNVSQPSINTILISHLSDRPERFGDEKVTDKRRTKKKKGLRRILKSWIMLYTDIHRLQCNKLATKKWRDNGRRRRRKVL